MPAKRPIITIHDVITNEITERPMTDEEWDQYKLDVAAHQAAKKAAKEAAAARQAILDRLGLTADEVALLLP